MYKLPKRFRKKAIFILDDDQEVMTAALSKGSDLGSENKYLNRLAIKSYNTTIRRIEANRLMRKRDINNLYEAVQIHANNGDNVAIKLRKLLDAIVNLIKQKGDVR